MKPLPLALFLLLIAGCSVYQDGGTPPDSASVQTVPGTPELALTEDDLQQLGMAPDFHNQDLQQLGITSNESNCHTEEQTAFDLSGVQYTVCSYAIDSLNGTQVIIELKSFTNLTEAEDAYQYDSSHLYSAEGLISEDEYGNRSRFRVSNEHDYGGQYNDPNVTYYHLWIAKGAYLIHITSKGSSDARDYIANTGKLILLKFG
ncbi:TPA: hypothetical protein HA295_01445 [Candidatus Woesearchaeota archaeon]|nr:MAG: hypothetical protein QT04_C0057G0001 [archaeon GW2011_AR11]HII65423.1 hypothetical protein [Candidatus Woesearchaeota archaeon]